MPAAQDKSGKLCDAFVRLGRVAKLIGIEAGVGGYFEPCRRYLKSGYFGRQPMILMVTAYVDEPLIGIMRNGRTNPDKGFPGERLVGPEYLDVARSGSKL